MTDHRPYVPPEHAADHGRGGIRRIAPGSSAPPAVQPPSISSPSLKTMAPDASSTSSSGVNRPVKPGGQTMSCRRPSSSRSQVTRASNGSPLRVAFRPTPRQAPEKVARVGNATDVAGDGDGVTPHPARRTAVTATKSQRKVAPSIPRRSRNSSTTRLRCDARTAVKAAWADVSPVAPAGRVGHPGGFRHSVALFGPTER